MFASITGVSRPTAAAYVHEGQRRGESLDVMIAKWFDQTEQQEGIRAFLTGPLDQVVDDADEGPFDDDAAFLRTLEALTTLQVVAYKLVLVPRC